MNDNNPDLRQAAVKALGQIGALAVDALLAKLTGRDRVALQTVVEVIRQIGASAVEPLISALMCKDWDLRLAASIVLDEIGWTPGQDETGGYYYRVKENWQRCVEIGPLAVPALLSALDDGDVRARQNRVAVLEALGQIGDLRVLDALLVYLAADDEKIRAAAQKVLVQIGSPALDTLLAALKDGDREVRLVAIEALSKIGGERAVEALLVAFQEGEQDSSQAAATALANIGDVGAVEALLVALRASDPDRRKTAIEALGKIGDPQAVDALIITLHESNRGVSRAACTALGKIGDARAVEALQTQLIDNDRMIRMAAAEALDAAGWKPGTNTASAYYWRDRLDFQKCVEIGAPAVDALLDAFQDNSWNVRLAAIEALEQIEDPQVIEALSALAQDSLLREEALTALERLGASGLEGLQAQLSGSDRIMRRAAAEALVAAGWKPGCDAASAYYWRDRLDFQNCVEIGAPGSGCTG